MAARSTAVKIALRTATSVSGALRALRFRPPAKRRWPRRTSEFLVPSSCLYFVSVRPSAMSISPFLKAAISALASSWRKITLSRTGFSPHHLSFGTRETVFAAESNLSTLNGPAIHSGCSSPVKPVLKISGVFTVCGMKPPNMSTRAGTPAGWW